MSLIFWNNISSDMIYKITQYCLFNTKCLSFGINKQWYTGLHNPNCWTEITQMDVDSCHRVIMKDIYRLQDIVLFKNLTKIITKLKTIHLDFYNSYVRCFISVSFFLSFIQSENEEKDNMRIKLSGINAVQNRLSLSKSDKNQKLEKLSLKICSTVHYILYQLIMLNRSTLQSIAISSHVPLEHEILLSLSALYPNIDSLTYPKLLHLTTNTFNDFLIQIVINSPLLQTITIHDPSDIYFNKDKPNLFLLTQSHIILPKTILSIAIVGSDVHNKLITMCDLEWPTSCSILSLPIYYISPTLPTWIHTLSLTGKLKPSVDQINIWKEKWNNILKESYITTITIESSLDIRTGHGNDFIIMLRQIIRSCSRLKVLHIARVTPTVTQMYQDFIETANLDCKMMRSPHILTITGLTGENIHKCKLGILCTNCEFIV